MFRHILALLTLTLCTRLVAAPVATDDSLYQRLGGQVVLKAVAADLIDVASRAPETRRSFDKVNLARVKDKLAEQLCVITGGPCTYTGDDMRLVHRGLKITEREFYAMVEQLRSVLDGKSVGTREKNELLALLAPMKTQIVDPVAPGP